MRILKKLTGHPERSIMPTSPLESDLYLTEFPKSGVTWLSFLIANINLALTQQHRVATFFNINELIPDIHVEQRLALPSANGIGFRVIKSHANFTPQYKRVFYIARNPYNVMASYFKFLSSLDIYPGDLEQFVRSKEFGISAWVTHVNGWLDQVSASTSFFLLRYEEMLADTAGVLRKMYGHLGYDLDEALLQLVIGRCSIANMRLDEANFNSSHPKLGKFNFVREVGMQGSRVEITEKLRAYISEEAADTIERLGYTKDGIWPSST
jgi:hypothetical protein